MMAWNKSKKCYLTPLKTASPSSKQCSTMEKLPDRTDLRFQ